MPPNALTRAGLADVVHRRVGLSRADAATLVERMIDQITAALVDGEEVKLSGFGTFSLRDKAARVGRNPRTKVAAPIAARRVTSFRPSQALRGRVSGIE